MSKKKKEAFQTTISVGGNPVFSVMPDLKTKRTCLFLHRGKNVVETVAEFRSNDAGEAFVHHLFLAFGIQAKDG